MTQTTGSVPADSAASAHRRRFCRANAIDPIGSTCGGTPAGSHRETLMAEERTLGQLVAEASQDLSELVRYEVALAKAEIKDDVSRGAKAGGMFAVAGFLGLLAIITLVITAAYALMETGLPAWAAFGIVTVALLVLAGLLVLVAILLIKRIKPPERAIRSTKKTIAAVRGRNGAANS
jgi:hypothetical protein